MAMETESIGSNNTCERFNSYAENNGTLIHGYEGIPHNLLINVICCVVMVSLFFVLRKFAWRYSQAALLGSSEASWSHLFDVNQRRDSTDSEQQEQQQQEQPLGGQCGQGENASLVACLTSYFRLTDAEVARVAGSDAVCYMQLQRYLLAYLLAVALPALAVVLPINIRGGYTDSVGEFSSTTINNLSGSSQLLWLHACLAGAYMLLAAGCMLHYSRRVVASDARGLSASCLLLRGLPPEARDTEALARHFREAYPAATVVGVDLAYDVRKLQQLHDENSMLQSVLQLCRDDSRKSHSEPSVTNCRCSWLCGGCCCGQQEAEGFYLARAAAVGAQLRAEAARTKDRKLPIAFVQFGDAADAGAVLSDFRRARSLLGRLRRLRPSASSLSAIVQPRSWTAQPAPQPEDVNWCNLPHAASRLWHLRAFVINAALLLLLFFFTTPLYIVTLLKAHNPRLPFHIAVLSEFLPTLFMWIFSAALPFAVYYSDILVQHWTKSSEHYAVMFKCSLFQILMILILPSFGLSRADALLQWLFSMSEHDSEQFRQRWQCVFVSENASFFVNYVITSACIGCCAELLRLPEMLRYAVSWFGARSHAEARLVFKKVASEFEYGFNLSWMLCVFAIVMTYANVAPLILLFGVLYLATKMLVDRYNVYYAYKPSSMDRSVHHLSQTVVLACALLGEVFVAGFFLFRIPLLSDPRTIFALLLVACSLCYLAVRAAMRIAAGGCCSALRRAGQRQRQEQQEQEEQQSYTPAVLLRSLEAGDPVPQTAE